MWRVRIIATAALSLWVPGGLFPPGLARQATGGSSDQPRFVVGTVSSNPGTTVSVPLIHAPGAGQPIGKLHLEVEFASGSVQFKEAQKGPASKVQDFNLTVKAAADSPGGKARSVRLTIDLWVLPGDTKEPLPEGVLASLDFTVAKDASLASIRLGPITVSAHDVSGNPVKATTEDGMIIVSAPVISCFFYMH